jgi:hypothetical protein
MRARERIAVSKVVLITWLSTGGCSVLFLHRPSPPASTAAEVACPRSALPKVDIVAGGAGVYVGAFMNDQHYNSGAATALILSGAALVVSGIWGDRTLNACNELEVAQRTRRQRQQRFEAFAAQAPAAALPSAPGPPPEPLTASAPTPADPWLAAGAPPEALGMDVLAPGPDGGTKSEAQP